MKINIRYRVIAPNLKTSEESLTILRNLSAGGLALSMDENIKVGTVLQLSIELPSDETPVVCLSRVVLSEGPMVDGTFFVGVCFLDMTGVDRARLDRFVSEEARQHE